MLDREKHRFIEERSSDKRALKKHFKRAKARQQQALHGRPPFFAAKLALASQFVVNEDEREYLTSSDEDISEGRDDHKVSVQSDDLQQIADQIPNLENEDDDRKSEKVVRKYSEDYDDDFMAMSRPAPGTEAHTDARS